MQQFVFYPVREFDGVLNEMLKAPEGSRYEIGFCEKSEEDVVLLVNNKNDHKEIAHYMNDILPLLEYRLGLKFDSHDMIEFDRHEYGFLFTTTSVVKES